MGQAQKQLGDKKPESSLKDQDHAIAEPEADAAGAREDDRGGARELLKLPFDQQAKKQEKTQHATDTLAKEMEKSDGAEDENANRSRRPARSACSRPCRSSAPPPVS
jgi:hypothetical protein